ncbi:MAG: methyltransferase domain-containing protein [Nannocystaceae bacterium]
MPDAGAHYDKFSRRYDLAALVLRRFQRQAVAALRLRPGDLVYDLGCGTGLLLEHLVAAVGPTGRVVGIDLSEGMLERARARVAGAGWDNVELVRADLTKYLPDERADSAIFCLSLSVIPVYEEVLAASVKLVKPGHRMVVADSWKCHGRWYHPLANWFIDRKAPWVSANPNNEVGACAARYLKEVTYKETMFGVYSIAAGICEG